MADMQNGVRSDSAPLDSVGEPQPPPQSKPIKDFRKAYLKVSIE
jgi:hypothetical protein